MRRAALKTPVSSCLGGGVALTNPQGDGDHIWFGSDRGIYLYTAGGGLQKVYASQAGPITAIAPAGLCG